MPSYKPNGCVSKLAHDEGGWVCVYCGHQLAHKPQHVDAFRTDRGPGKPPLYAARAGWRMPERDHVVPISSGGTDSWENAVLCCCECNRDKANQRVEEWLLAFIGEADETYRPAVGRPRPYVA